MPALCNTFWSGPMGAVERACLRSALHHGHQVALYCYAEPPGAPEGVAIMDAAEIIPERQVIRYRSGSLALFANWFRYELQRRGRGLWIDSDLYLLAPIEIADANVFGWQEPGVINNSVLRLPADSPLLPPLLALFQERRVPPWMPLRARLAAYWRLMRTGRSGLAHMPWGATGPYALSALAKRHRLGRLAQPRGVFYPVHWRDAGWVADPARSLASVITPDTVAIHLWNERIKQFKERPAESGSFLARLQREGA